MTAISIDSDTAARFVEMFQQADFAHDVAPAMTCTESDAIVGMLRALDAPDAADIWATAHAAHDDGGDAHGDATDGAEPEKSEAL